MISNSKKPGKLLLFLAFAYAAVMLWLLFGRSRYDIGHGYWETMKGNINLIPLHTLRGMFYLLKKQPNPYLVSFAYVNLFGNIAAFVPLGLLLPCLWKPMRSIGYFLLCTVFLIIAVELIQLFSLRGSCDIDDLILNVIGALIGYLLLLPFRRKMIKERGC